MAERDAKKVAEVLGAEIAAGLIEATWTACKWEDTKEPKYRLRMDAECFELDAGKNTGSIWIDFEDMAAVIAMLQSGLAVRDYLRGEQ